MFKKILTKTIFCATALCMTGALAATSACTLESKHPTVKITVEFDGNDYELDYTLYRNLYPNTVRRFIELAENNFYDGTVIHDYNANDWFGGGFSYVQEEYDAAVSGGSVTEYLETHSKEDAFMQLFKEGYLTPTVYSAYRYDEKDNRVLVAEDALPTLVGEFNNNIQQTIESGALTESFGTLKMYYYGKESSNKVYVTPTEGSNVMANYKTNCATMLFAMQVGSSSSLTASDYCIFGRMEKTDKLTELTQAVNDEISYDDAIKANSVTVENAVEVFSTDPADSNMDKDFSLPSKVIVVKEVKVTKY